MNRILCESPECGTIVSLECPEQVASIDCPGCGRPIQAPLPGGVHWLRSTGRKTTTAPGPTGFSILPALAIVGSLVLLMVAAGVGLVLYLLWTGIRTGRQTMPPALATGRVLTGEGLVVREAFFRGPDLGSITDIQPAPGSTGDEFVIVGTCGAVRVDREGQVRTRLGFEQPGSRIRTFRVPGSARYEYLERGSWGADIRRIGPDGRNVWTYGGLSGVDDCAVGDVNGDGLLEFAVGFNGGGGLHLLDFAGKRVWERSDANVWHVEMVDVDGDGLAEIVHSNAGGQIVVRDSRGEPTSRANPEPYVSHFAVSRWPSRLDREYVVVARDDRLWILGFDGSVAKTLPAPDCGGLGDTRATPVKFLDADAHHYAAMVTFKNWDRALLLIYDAGGDLQYREVLDEGASALAPGPADEPGRETLLVGSGATVWRYRIPAGPGRPPEVPGGDAGRRTDRDVPAPAGPPVRSESPP